MVHAAEIALMLFACGVFVFWLNPPWPRLAAYLVLGDEPEASDVIIVLSGDTEREIYAAELYQRGLAKKIIMSGVRPAAGRMAQRAADKGVRAQDMILEDKSVSTYDNAVYSRDIMLKHQFKSALVVSSPYHMRRSRLVFDRVFKGDGIKLIYCPVPNSWFSRDIQCKSSTARQIVAREYVKLFYYWARYW